MTPKKILRRPSPEITPDWGQNLPPLLRRLYAARGVTSDEQLSYTLKHLASPMELRGIDRAVALLTEAITNQQRVLVLGDFDAAPPPAKKVSKSRSSRGFRYTA